MRPDDHAPPPTNLQRWADVRGLRLSWELDAGRVSLCARPAMSASFVAERWTGRSMKRVLRQAEADLRRRGEIGGGR